MPKSIASWAALVQMKPTGKRKSTDRSYNSRVPELVLRVRIKCHPDASCSAYVPNRAVPSAWLSPSLAQWRWYMLVNSCLTLRISLACIAISEAWPLAPPEGSVWLSPIQEHVRPRQRRTVDHDACIWEAMSFASLTSSEQK